MCMLVLYNIFIVDEAAGTEIRGESGGMLMVLQ